METISLKQLKENVEAFYQAGIFECDKQFEQSPLFKVPANAFEIVSEKAGSPNKLLVPCEGQYSALFRGQSKDFSPCVPTLYRGDYTVTDVFVERLRLAVLIELLDSHPVVKEIFIKNLQVFADTVTGQDLQFIPLSEFPDSWNESETFLTPSQNL